MYFAFKRCYILNSCVHSKLTVVAIMLRTKAIIYGCISELQHHAYSPLTHQHKEATIRTPRENLLGVGSTKPIQVGMYK